MAVFKSAVVLKEKGYATMAKSTVVPFELPTEFSHDPLTEVIQAGAKELLRTAVQAEVSGFIAEHAHLLDEEGRQRLVRHGDLPPINRAIQKESLFLYGPTPNLLPPLTRVFLL